jgi:hypothetical protein
MGKEARSIEDFVAKLSAYCKREDIDMPANIQETITAFSEYWSI